MVRRSPSPRAWRRVKPARGLPLPLWGYQFIWLTTTVHRTSCLVLGVGDGALLSCHPPEAIQTRTYLAEVYELGHYAQGAYFERRCSA